MKETVRTASVMEIYNEAINALETEKRILQGQLTAENAKYTAKKGLYGTLHIVLKIVSIASYLFFGLLSSFGIGSLLVGDIDNVNVAIFLIIFCGTLFAIGFFSWKKAKEFKAYYQGTFEPPIIVELEGKIQEIKFQIEERKTRKKSMLEAEEVIISKDLVPEKETFADTHTLVERKQLPKEFDTKECPMCGEDVKFKAKICRFCNYDFETGKRP
jgi:hypothetical protein